MPDTALHETLSTLADYAADMTLARAQTDLH